MAVILFEADSLEMLCRDCSAILNLQQCLLALSGGSLAGRPPASAL